MVHRAISLTLLFTISLATGCDKPVRGIEMPIRYQPALMLRTSVAPVQGSEIHLQIPDGYKPTPDAPRKVVAHQQLRSNYQGDTVIFENPVDGERAWIEVYFCEAIEETICAFRSIEVLLDDAAAVFASVSVPAP